MTVFVLVCAAMIAAALLWILLPLWRRADADEAPSVRERGVASVVVALAVPAIAVAMYGMLSNWKWDEAQRQQEQTAQLDGMLRQLEDRLKSNPNDLNGWLLLGRSYATMGRYPLAVDAYQQAYDLSKGENIEATIGLGEALFFTDQASLGGRAGQLFEDALARAPNHPKALWYGSIAALHAGDLVRGRDRLKLLAAQNPPQEIQAVLQRQIQDLDEQIAAAGGAPMSGGEGSQSAAAPGRSIDVAVSIAPEIESKLSGPVPLFVLARDPAGGPPLAVQRLSSEAAPLRVRLSESDAMMATRTLASVTRVQVVARLSLSGSPQAQKGDYFGEAYFDFGKDSGTLNIIIDRAVP